MASRWLFLVLCTCVLPWSALVNAGEGEDSRASPPGTKHIEIFQDKSLFDIKRRQQIEAAEKVWNIDDYAKQYKTIAFVMETIFPILKESLEEIQEMDYQPGSSPFPEEESTQEVLGKVYENLIFFGDFLLRMPDITKKVFKKHKEWAPALKEAVQFCNKSTDIYTGPHARQLHLMSQELGLVPVEEGYINPFKGEHTAKAQKDNAFAERNKGKKDAKKKRPKLRSSKQFKTEL